jgi:hypothetical protein
MAFAPAGMWFFGTIIAMVVFLPTMIKDRSFGEQVTILLICGIVVAGAVFCYEWYEYERKKNEREDLERRRPANRNP